jgi:hypothetical protein
MRARCTVFRNKPGCTYPKNYVSTCKYLDRIPSNPFYPFNADVSYSTKRIITCEALTLAISCFTLDPVCIQ